MYSVITPKLKFTSGQKEALDGLFGVVRLIYSRYQELLLNEYEQKLGKDMSDVQKYIEMLNYDFRNNEWLRKYDTAIFIRVVRDLYAFTKSGRNLIRYTPGAKTNDDKITIHLPLKSANCKKQTIHIEGVGDIQCVGIDRTQPYVKGDIAITNVKGALEYSVSVNYNYRPDSPMKVCVDDHKKRTLKCLIDKPVEELKVIGVDYGFHDLATLSNGDKFTVPEEILRLQKRSVYYQSKLDSASDGSKSKLKWTRKYADTCRRMKTKMNAFVNDVALQIAEKYDIISVEHYGDIRFNNVYSSRHSSTVIHSGVCEFYHALRHACRKTGSIVYYVDRWFPSTQICSVCGCQNHHIAGKLHVRKWKCPVCGAVHDRDVNAAINMRHYAYEKLGISTALHGYVRKEEIRKSISTRRKIVRRSRFNRGCVSHSNSTKYYTRSNIDLGKDIKQFNNIANVESISYLDTANMNEDLKRDIENEIVDTDSYSESTAQKIENKSIDTITYDVPDFHIPCCMNCRVDSVDSTLSLIDMANQYTKPENDKWESLVESASDCWTCDDVNVADNNTEAIFGQFYYNQSMLTNMMIANWKDIIELTDGIGIYRVKREDIPDDRVAWKYKPDGDDKDDIFFELGMVDGTAFSNLHSLFAMQIVEMLSRKYNHKRLTIGLDDDELVNITMKGIPVIKEYIREADKYFGF